MLTVLESEREGPMIDLEMAKRKVKAYLDAMRYKDGLDISGVQEYPCGWVFYWNSVKYIRTQDNKYMLGGNVPIFVDRSDGVMYLIPFRARYDPDRYPDGLSELTRLTMTE